LFYNFKVDKKNITVIPTDKFEISEEILKFLDNVEVLIIKGTKDAAKTFENIEAKVVVPYGELKSTFFTAL
jgi:carbon monoxide dehydrogenase subunit G